MPQPKFPEIEEEILKYWEDNKVFEKSLDKPSPKGNFVFYDGPPFATGLPHYGHIVASLMKDVVPRFWTMRGYRVERKWGWDCHGLPIENIVEKELGTKSKKEIEEMGVAKFNELCRSKVLGYVGEWEKTIRRLGRWVDMKNAYRTMDRDYMESVWWVFKQLWDKELIYEDYRSMHICPRCETTLSQQEVSEGYKEVKDISVVAKFEIHNPSQPPLTLRGGDESAPVYMLAWTTTPWTLPGNVALAVGKEIEYVVARVQSSQSTVHSTMNREPTTENFILAKARLATLGDCYEIVQELKGKELAGLKYEPIFPYYKNTKNAFRVVAGDFVTTEDGTGIVHIAPAFGDDDFKVGKREKIPLVQHVGMDGRFKAEVTDFAGQEVKPKSDDDRIRLSADIAVVKYLQDHGLFFSKQNITHTYPHCWRCDTPLLNYATSSWFVKVTKIKNKALKSAKKINWSPEHIKEGRFGKWLEGARDWSISRQRFWASVMPVWRCGACKEYKVFGAVSDLEKASGETINDLHKHIVDEIFFPCEKCGGQMRRIPDVLDTWFDSGSMPYAQAHYPFENKEKFETSFPAEFIAEGQDQTRAWFYYLHVLASALLGKRAYSNVIVNGIVLAEDGKKMSKKLQNYPDPNVIFEKYGADALRYYLVTSPVMHAENLNFSEAGVREMYNKVVSMLLNVLEFYKLYAGANSESIANSRISNSKIRKFEANSQFAPSRHVLDRWIVARLHQLIKEVTENTEAYKLSEASRPIQDFIADLSQWYLRRSRERFKSSKKREREAVLNTTSYVLHTLSQIMAPFMPFLAEHIYCEIRNSKSEIRNFVESVHLTEWPKFQKRKIDQTLLEEMRIARKIVELAHAARAEAKMKVRQPLSELRVTSYELGMSEELLKLIAEEVNVKEVKVVEKVQEGDGWVGKEDAGLKIALNIALTPELQKEGLLREITRQINDLRKTAGLTPSDKVDILIAMVDQSNQSPLPAGEDGVRGVIKDFQKQLRKSVIAKSVKIVPTPQEVEWSHELELDNQEKIWVGMSR
ncbi:MAG: isoleucine--tRNA ligase [bacterium]|nr:isoleucine--tRNA ligase [bacterium]